jgi:prevent-host-death family protein
MTTIAHRDLRNDSAELLRRAAAGESFEVTNHGRVVAMLVPPPSSPLERHLAARMMTPPTARRLPHIDRVTSDVSTRSILDDLRGDR